MPDLQALVAAVRSAPGLLGKRDVSVIERLGGAIDGDDAALVEYRGEYLVVCGEAISPPFLRADPFGAGTAAVVTNVSDVRAMGGRPLALVDMLVSPDREHAERVLDGIARASELLGVPVVGGHVTIGEEPALSASCTGVARAPLRAAAARPGDVLLAAFALDGRYMSDRRPFFSALDDRTPEQLRDDGEALVEVAEAGWCHAARDVSMPGVAGSLLQMIEGAGCGARLDLDALPRPGEALARALAADVPELRLPARRAGRARRRRVRGVHPPRARVRAVRDVRRHARPAARVRRFRGAGVGPGRHAPHGVGTSGIAIGWCMTPW